MICEAHRRTHRHSMVRWTVTSEWKWESVFFYMRFDVCTDPEPKEAESLETDLNADSSLFREWCVWVSLMLQQHLYKTEDGSEQWHTHTDQVAECVLPPSLDSKVLISIKNPDVLKTRQPDWSWPILLLPVRFPAAFFHSSLLSDLFTCSYVWRNVVIKIWFCVSTYREAMHAFQHHTSHFFALPHTIWTDPETHAAFENWDMRAFWWILEFKVGPTFWSTAQQQVWVM